MLDRGVPKEHSIYCYKREWLVIEDSRMQPKEEGREGVCSGCLRRGHPAELDASPDDKSGPVRVDRGPVYSTSFMVEPVGDLNIFYFSSWGTCCMTSKQFTTYISFDKLFLSKNQLHIYKVLRQTQVDSFVCMQMVRAPCSRVGSGESS